MHERDDHDDDDDDDDNDEKYNGDDHVMPLLRLSTARSAHSSRPPLLREEGCNEITH